MLFRWMVDSGAGTWGVREIAFKVGMSPSTSHRILSALRREGYVQREPDGRYGLGLEFYRMALSATNGFPLHRVALKYLRELVAAFNETVSLGVYREDTREMMFAFLVESTHPLRYVIETNRWLPIYAGASGLAILAFINDEDRQAVVRQTGLKPVTDRTITDPAILERQIARIRQRGYALSRGERIHGAVGLAAPIFGPNHRVLGDVCLTIPEARFDSKQEAWLAQRLMSCANAISAEFEAQNGSSPGPPQIRTRG